MTTQPRTPLQTALAHHTAWTARDLDGAMALVAGDVVCDAPAGRLEGAAAYRAFLDGFLWIFRRAELTAAFGDDRTAVLLYETETVPVPRSPAAEHVTVRHGRITHIRFVFDRLPFEAAALAAAGAVD